MKKLIQLKLKYWAKFILLKYKPQIIGITGSVGKTSTKEAIYTVLKIKKRVRKNIKNYNNEFGLPLTIIGAESPGRNLLGWFGLGFRVLKMLVITDKNYPEVLVLEMGIDRPGDMDYLNTIAKPNIGVITTIGSVHLEYFKNRNELAKEKAKLIKNIVKGGHAIINIDDEMTKKMQDNSKVRVINYGLDEKAMLRASDISFSYEDKGNLNRLTGVIFKMTYDGSTVPVHLKNALGTGAVYSALAATSVGLAYGMNLLEISQSLQNYKSPKGRLNVLPGIKNTIIIDDTYNSEPKSLSLALQVLKNLELRHGARKYAVLGDMLELGSLSVQSHKDIGKYIAKSKINKLLVVGERARDIVRGARERGMRQEDVFMFDNSSEAGKFLQKRIKEGDIILAKGSQGMRMEKIILELMAEPLRAKELLVRQGGEWKNK